MTRLLIVDDNDDNRNMLSRRLRRRGYDVECAPYIVMELLEGEPLQSRLERHGAYAFPEAVDVMLPVISAVSSAHDVDVVHRDLKPANIFLARGPGAKTLPIVLDFGIRARSGQDPQPADIAVNGQDE